MSSESPEMDQLIKQYSSKSTLSMLLEESPSPIHDKYNMDEEILYDDFDSTLEQYNRKNTNGVNQEKVNFSCKDLIRAVYNSEISKNDFNNEDKFKSPNMTDSPTLKSFGLLAAEDDGSVMDDLPEFSTSTDVLAMGIEDFILIDKKTSAHLMHVRITQPTITENNTKKLSVGSTVEVMHYSSHNMELNKETSLGFEDLDMSGLDDIPSRTDSPHTRDRQDSDSGRYGAGIIQICRTKSEDDQMMASTLSAALADSLSTSADGATLMQKHADWRHTLSPIYTTSPTSPKSPKSPRARSSSGNLLISCRLPGSERWSVPKSIPVPSNTSPLNRSTLRIRAVSTATGSNIKPPTPNRMIPTSSAATGNAMRINTEFSKPMNRKNFDDTSSDPFRQYADQQARQQKHRAHSNSLPEGDLNSMLFSLNPHTSSSKMVLTPTNSTSRPGSAMSNTSAKDSAEKKFFVSSSSSSAAKSSLPPKVVRVINATTESKTSPVPNTNTSSKELAAYFNTMSLHDALSDSDSDDDMGFGGGGGGKDKASHAFSFMDSLPMAAPIHNTSPPTGKPTKHGASSMSLSSKASSQSMGIAADAVDCGHTDDLTAACSSGSDYSASDYEALHSIHINVHADIMSKRGSGSNGHNSSQSLSILKDTINSPPRHPVNNVSQPTTPTGASRARTRTDSNASNTSARARTESEVAKRPSLFERFFGSPATKTRKTLDASEGDSLSRRSSRNTMESRPPVEEEDGDGTSYVRNLDTGAVIELDADGDGAVTAILVSPSVVFRDDSSPRSRVNSEFNR